MEEAGYSCSKCEYIQRETVNKKEGLCVPRIFVQAKFIKYDSTKDRTSCLNVEHVNVTSDSCKNLTVNSDSSENVTAKSDSSANLT